MFRFFETLIDPFRAHDPRMPPPTLAGFYWHYVREVWPVLAALMGIGLVISLIEVSIFRFVGAIVDMLENDDAGAGARRLWLDIRVDGGGRDHRPADRDDHPRSSGPAVAGAFVHEPRALADPPLCAPETVGFFTNDFAGRIASKIIQTGPGLRESAVQVCDAIWFVTIYRQLAGALRASRRLVDRRRSPSGSAFSSASSFISCRGSASGR